MARLKIGNVFPPLAYLLKHCAPAGYGLGVPSHYEKHPEDIDAVFKSGYYLLTMETANTSTEILHVLARTDTECVQERYSSLDNSYRRRYTLNGSDGWSGWEWDNPPMQPGVEYRTTERWNGKPVYIKAVELGNLPDAANTMGTAWVDGSFYGSGVKSVISCGGCLYKGTEWAGALPYFSVGVQVYVVASNTTVGVWASDGSFSDRTATVWVKYTKD